MSEPYKILWNKSRILRNVSYFLTRINEVYDWRFNSIYEANMKNY